MILPQSVLVSLCLFFSWTAFCAASPVSNATSSKAGNPEILALANQDIVWNFIVNDGLSTIKVPVADLTRRSSNLENDLETNLNQKRTFKTTCISFKLDVSGSSSSGSSTSTFSLVQQTCKCFTTVGTAAAEILLTVNQYNLQALAVVLGISKAQASAGVASAIKTSLTKTITSLKCNYPTHSVPASTCANTCAFKCQAGFCGQNCQSACPSGGVHHKRAVICASGMQACAAWSGGPLECVSTTSDLESCGGCQFPADGQSTGVDCSTLPGMKAVTCDVGMCVIQACLHGYEKIDNQCVRSRNQRTNALRVQRKRSSAAATLGRLTVIQRRS